MLIDQCILNFWVSPNLPPPFMKNLETTCLQWYIIYRDQCFHIEGRCLSLEAPATVW